MALLALPPEEPGASPAPPTAPAPAASALAGGGAALPGSAPAMQSSAAPQAAAGAAGRNGAVGLQAAGAPVAGSAAEPLPAKGPGRPTPAAGGSHRQVPSVVLELRLTSLDASYFVQGERGGRVEAHAHVSLLRAVAALQLFAAGVEAQVRPREGVVCL